MGVPRQCDEPGGVALTPHAGQSAHATSAAAVRPVPEVLYLPAAQPSRHADASEVFPLCGPYLALGHATHMVAVAAPLLLCFHDPAGQPLAAGRQRLVVGSQNLPPAQSEAESGHIVDESSPEVVQQQSREREEEEAAQVELVVSRLA